MSEEISNKKKVALSARAIDKMKAGDAVKSDIGEYSGLRVVCGKTGLKSFVYRYRSPYLGVAITTQKYYSESKTKH